ncbi:RING-H2 finger protein ATL3-like [Corylus avellana]|uniref:RING-H2 finger protein ATL3-like n=1 Tax=Corylus avellana TaxID=13451 RepID=UPI001E2234CE|nr:RING-H2 finger protein ATL3-like [Corylus avellana]
MDGSSSDSKLDNSGVVELTGKIMVVAIIVLFMVVVFVLFLHLYAKWFWWSIDEATTNNTPRRRRRRRFVFAPGQDPAVAATMRRGLEPSVLRSLPVLIFDPQAFKDGLECAVCLSELVQGEKARLLPKCNHGFHVDCIDMWFQSHSTCPLCRNPVAPEISISNTSTGEVAAEDVEASGENLASGFSTESPNFPTNVLFWGNQTQVSSLGACLEEGPSSQCPSCPSSSSSSSASSRPADGMLVIDIPRQVTENLPSLSPSASRFSEEESKSPVTTRLRSLKRLLSRDNRRASPCSPGSVDVEQAGRAQS